MDRLSSRYGYLLISLSLLGAIVSVIGCRSVLTTAAYLIKGTNVDADFEGLEEKRVAVICRPVTAITFRHDVSNDLAQEVAHLLQERVKDIEVIDHAKVREFTDENTWDEFTEVAEHIEADMVVGIDLEDFTIFNQGQAFYQGRATATVWVYDCVEGGTHVYKTELPQILYPPNSARLASDLPQAQFRSRFVHVLADQIGRHFYPHDPHANFAVDVDALQ